MDARELGKWFKEVLPAREWAVELGGDITVIVSLLALLERAVKQLEFAHSPNHAGQNCTVCALLADLRTVLGREGGG